MVSLETLDQSQQELMSVFNCNTAWPVCLFDFTVKSKCPNFFVFRVQPPLDSFVKQDYFYAGGSPAVGGLYKPSKQPELLPQNLLIERNHHLCSAHKNFERNFKTRFTAADSKLFDNHLLNLLFENELKLEQAKSDFIKEVSKSVDP